MINPSKCISVVLKNEEAPQAVPGRQPQNQFVLASNNLVQPFQKFKNFEIPPLPKTSFGKPPSLDQAQAMAQTRPPASNNSVCPRQMNNTTNTFKVNDHANNIPQAISINPNRHYPHHEFPVCPVIMPNTTFQRQSSEPQMRAKPPLPTSNSNNPPNHISKIFMKQSSVNLPLSHSDLVMNAQYQAPFASSCVAVNRSTPPLPSPSGTGGGTSHHQHHHHPAHPPPFRNSSFSTPPSTPTLPPRPPSSTSSKGLPWCSPPSSPSATSASGFVTPPTSPPLRRPSRSAVRTPSPLRQRSASPLSSGGSKPGSPINPPESPTGSPVDHVALPGFRSRSIPREKSLPPMPRSAPPPPPPLSIL